MWEVHSANMKITIITVVYNNVDTIADTLQSVATQTYPDIEHIVVDGASTDGTLEVLKRLGAHVAQLVTEPDAGIYDAMNKGLKLATGDVIGFLNADDIFLNIDMVARIAEVMSDPLLDACYANLYYVDRQQTDIVKRVWRSRDYEPGLCAKGWMPAHPTFYVRKYVYEKYGVFDLTFQLQSDFDLAMRFLEINKINTRFVPEFWVRMRMGGASNNSILNVIKGNWEAYLACRKYGIRVPPWFMVTKVLSRLKQFSDLPPNDKCLRS